MRVFVLAIACLGLLSCSDAEKRASATRLSTTGQRIGGPKALGEVGDYLLENDKIRLIIHGPNLSPSDQVTAGRGANRGTTIFPGSLIDADLQRPGGQRAQGMDQLGELFPAFVFEAMDTTTFSISADGSDGGPAIVTLEGVGGDMLESVALLNTALIFPLGLSFRVDYILEPGKNFVEIKTTVTNTGDDVHRFPYVDPPGLRDFGIDLPGLEDLQISTPFGHYLVLGAEQHSFATGPAGHDIRFKVEDLYETAGGLPAFPGLVTDFLATSGDGVSYGLTHSGAPSNYPKSFEGFYPGQTVKDFSLLVPFLFSSVTAVYHTNPPDALAIGEEFSYSVYFIVGRGDVASIADTVWDIHDVPTGTFSGRVYDEQSQEALAHASIVLRKADGSFASQVKTDANGNFRCELPAGTYAYQLVDDTREREVARQMTITSAQTTSVLLPIAPPGHIAVEVVDTDGRPLPSKVTLVGTFDPADQQTDPRDFLYNLSLGERTRSTTFDPNQNEFVENSWYTGNGLLTAAVRPGTYDLVVSRGVEYDLHKETITVLPGNSIQRSVALQKSVDSTGYVSADLHVHAVNSVDSSMSLEDRVVSLAAEGVEFAAATDHNAVTDYAPAIASMGLTQWLVSTVGTETTTFEMGHFNGYPLKHNSGSVRGGDVVWAGVTPDEIFQQIRDLGKYGPADTLVQVNHPRWDLLGYFNAFLFDQEVGGPTTVSGISSVFAPFSPEFAPENFSLDFDVLEILNGKRLDLVHNYRVPSVLPEPPLPAPENIPPAGEILRADTGAIAFPGALEDWFSLLNLGYRHIAVGASDSHRASSEAGTPRTMVWLGDKAKPGAFSDRDVVEGLRSRNVFFTTGPMVQFTVNGQPIGSDVRDTDGTVDVQIRVQTPNWLDANRAIVYANGTAIADISIPSSESGDYTASQAITIDRDTWLVVEVTGATNLFPLVTPREFPATSPDVIIDALAVSFDLSALNPYGNLQPQETQQVTPLAVTNPIWIDFDGSGAFDPPGTLPVTRQPNPTQIPDVRATFDSFARESN